MYTYHSKTSIFNRLDRTPGLARLVLLAVVLFGWAGAAYAATGTPIIGEVERITINTRNDHWSGGIIQVGGQNVIIPRNVLIDLPANRLTLKEIYDQAPAACLALGETGLAKGDACNSTGAGGYATIHANTTAAGNVIAGDVFIAKGIETVTGQVTYIDYDNGYYRLGGLPGSATTGVMVRLNDPDGRHTVQQGPGCAGGPNCSPDPRFTLDADNYTNVFSSGYPVCIPSTLPRTLTTGLPAASGVAAIPAGTTSQAAGDGTGDLLCPDTNRPASGVAADSRRFAPVKIGDSVTAEGNFETIAGVRFLSSHSTMVMTGVASRPSPDQPDYMFLDEVEIDMPAFQNERVRTLIIGYTTQAPADVLIWSLHYDPQTNAAHEFPLASSLGCDNAAGAGTCARQGLAANGMDIFKIRHDIDFLVGADPKLNPCSHLRADDRMGGTSICPGGGTSTVEMFGILSPIPHEIQGRTGKFFASLQPGGSPLIALDVNGNQTTWGQYLFPFGIGLGGLAPVEPNEFDLNAVAMPFYFSGLPWALDRRLSPAGCNGACESTPQPLDPFPFEGSDPRTQAALPTGVYSDPNFTNNPLANSRNRIFSFVDGNIGNFNGNATVLAWPPADPGLIDITEAIPVLACSAAGGGGTLNSPPVAVNDVQTATAGTPLTISVLGNDSDPNGDTIAVTSVGVVTPAGAGSASITPDSTGIIFTAAAGFTGDATFTYTIIDAPGATASASVTVTVTAAAPLNDPPVAGNDLGSTNEDTPVTLSVLANDTDTNPVDAANLTVISVTQGANGTVAINNLGAVNNTVSYTPNANFNGNDSFSYTVSDPVGGTATATVTITVAPVNDLPVAANDSGSTAQATAVTLSVLVNDTDADGNALTVTAAGPSADGTVAFTANSVTFTPAAAFSGTTTFPYTISDGNGGTATGSVTVSVNVVNTPPVAVNDTATTSQLTAATIPVLANDTDANGNPLTVTAAGPSANGTVTFNATSVTFTPNPTFAGVASFPYTISDGNGGTATATVSVTVTAVNTAPVAVNDTATTNQLTAINIAVLANDTDANGNPLTVTAAGPSANGTVTFNATSVTFTPNPTFAGVASFPYTISDGNGGTATATVSVTVTAVNTAPVAVNDTATTNQLTAINIAVLANDTDANGNPLTVTAAGPSANGAVTFTATSVRFAPNPTFAGVASFPYTISDGNGGTATATVSVTVTAVNTPPVAVNDSATTAQTVATTVSVLANDTDANGNLLAVIAAGPSANGTVTFTANSVTFTPAAAFSGTASFPYTITDGNGGTASATVTVTVTADTVAPVATAPVMSISAPRTQSPGTVPATVTWSATDAGSGVASYQLQQSLNGGAFTNVTLPAPNSTSVQLNLAAGTYRYQVRATDRAGNVSTFQVGPATIAVLRSETNTTNTGTWTRVGVTGASGGALSFATATGATARLDFQGRSVGWIAVTGPDRGIAQIFMDGSATPVATVDLYSPTTQLTQVVFAANGLNPAVNHSLTIRVTGTRNPASTGTRVDVDGFGLLR
jgi:hypothetical protein